MDVVDFSPRKFHRFWSEFWLLNERCAQETQMPKRTREDRPARSSGGCSTIVRLNVGGEQFTTRLSTLQAVPDSVIGKMFEENSPFGEPSRDEDGDVFIDCDPEVFRVILNFLRRGGVFVGGGGMGRSLLEQVSQDAEYYGLVRALSNRSRVPSPRPRLSVLDCPSQLTLKTECDELLCRLEAADSQRESANESLGSLGAIAEKLTSIAESFEGIIETRVEVEGVDEMGRLMGRGVLSTSEGARLRTIRVDAQHNIMSDHARY